MSRSTPGLPQPLLERFETRAAMAHDTGEGSSTLANNLSLQTRSTSRGRGSSGEEHRGRRVEARAISKTTRPFSPGGALPPSTRPPVEARSRDSSASEDRGDRSERKYRRRTAIRQRRLPDAIEPGTGNLAAPPDQSRDPAPERLPPGLQEATRSLRQEPPKETGSEAPIATRTRALSRARARDQRPETLAQTREEAGTKNPQSKRGARAVPLHFPEILHLERESGSSRYSREAGRTARRDGAACGATFPGAARRRQDRKLR
jgi:hypothetical protein